jgi:hypothetical protein
LLRWLRNLVLAIALAIAGLSTLQLGAAEDLCDAHDQTAYVYHPERLQVVEACATVTGWIVERYGGEGDGDAVLIVDLDPGSRGILDAADPRGFLIVELVCTQAIEPADAAPDRLCPGDRHPLSIPALGAHVRLTGQWVRDVPHGGWSEIHPLYSWSVSPTTAPAPATGNDTIPQRAQQKHGKLSA